MTEKQISIGWSEARVTSLKKLWADGNSAGQIAAILKGNLTRSAVIGKVHRLGLTAANRSKPSAPKRATLAPKVSRSHVRPPKPGPQNKPAVILGAYSVSTEAQRIERAAEGASAHARVARGANVDSPNARPFMEATDGCKWPLGDRGAISYCCNPLAGGEGWGRTWCAGHVAVGLAEMQPKGLKPRDATRFTRFEANDRYAPARPSMPVSAWDEARMEAA